MFGLFKNKKSSKGFDATRLKVDMHSHLLPKIDDGSDSIETSLELISGLTRLGYSQLITTPHIRWDIFRNTRDIILDRLEMVQNEMLRNDINASLKAAAEYYLDDYIMDLLRKKQPLLTLGKQILLVEFSMMRLPFNIREMIFDVLMAGYIPLIAHPERYTYLSGKYDLFHELKENGCLFQMNLLSVTRQYGKTTPGMATYMMKHQLYDLVGTDLHHKGQLEMLNKLEVNADLESLINRIEQNSLL